MVDNKIFELWKLKKGYSRPFEFEFEQLGSVYELDYEFNSLEVAGAGLDGIYVLMRKGRKTPIIIFNTKSFIKRN